MVQGKEYYAFISYKREDEKWAKWLQDKLEHYKFPTNLNGRTDLPKNIRPTFRDVTDLKPGLLAEEINNALHNSQWLIVVCSPRAAKSPWVCKEAQTFIDLGRADHIIPFVIEGNPFSNDTATECYPEALLNLTGSKELLAANIDEMGRDAAAIKVVACMFNLRFDTLWQRYEREQRRKRWMWMGGFLLLALLGIGIGAYFVRQNRTIENQNIQLENERNNVLRANANLNISLMKTFLSQNRPEMALVVLNDIKPNVGLLDSVQMNDLLLLKESLCDSILTSTMILANILDAEERKLLDYTTLLKSCDVVDIQHADDEEFLHIYNKESNQKDTILGSPLFNYITTCGITHIATYQDGETDFDENMDTIYTHGKAGIRIYSLQTGKMEHFIGCWGYFPWMTYAMSLSNNGKSLIYHEYQRSFEKTWLVNFDTGQRIPLNTSYSNSYDDVISSFSPNDKWFYLYYPEIKKIEIYSTQSLKAIHTFRYEDCDTVYWDASNNVCISSRGKVYSWRLIDKKNNFTFSLGSFANGVNISKKYAATACDDGRIYIWDILLGKIIFEKEIMDAPEDVAFTKDETKLWVISGYNCVKTIDLKSKKVESVYDEDPELAPPHPWHSYLYMTRDGEHCISRCYYADQYTIFDIKGNIIKTVKQYDDHIIYYPEDILSEFVFPEEFDSLSNLTNSQITIPSTRRKSSDGKMCIEGYSNGVIKVYSIQDRNTIYSLIMGEDGLINKNRLEHGRE